MVWLQFLVPGVLLSIIGLCNSQVKSFAVGRLGKRLMQGAGRWRQRITSIVFIALGLRWRCSSVS